MYLCVHLEFLRQLLLFLDQYLVFIFAQSDLTKTWMDLDELEVDQRSTLYIQTHVKNTKSFSDLVTNVNIKVKSHM